MGRLVAQGLTEKRYTVVIDNRGGAGGAIGADMVAKATPDGYTLVLANNTTHVMVTALNSKPPYDPLRDFTPISMTTYAPQLLVAGPSISSRTVAESSSRWPRPNRARSITPPAASARRRISRPSCCC